jgi:CRP/FNR family cyclic AMP-dependent transcriptional regulator
MTEMDFDLNRALARTHAFCGLLPEDIARIAPLVQIRRYRVGDRVVSLDGRDCDLHLVLDGNLTVESASGERIANLGAGSSVGEIALLDQQPRSATVRATTDSVVASMPALDLWMLMEKTPDIGRTILFNIGRVLAGRLRSANALH